MAGPKKDSDFSRGPSRAPNGNRQSFRTDTAISNNNGFHERRLQRWQPEGGAPSFADGGLESGNQSSSGGWDQFAANEHRFGVTTDYNEDIYTTSINRNHPQYKDRLAAAERTARDIEKGAVLTQHQAEERIMDFIGADKGGDEEAKYSGVSRNNNNDFPALSSSAGKYQPPAKRAASNQATVGGAPFDPAIISSQLRNPVGPTTKRTQNQDVSGASRQANQSPALKTSEIKSTSPRDDTKKPDAPATPVTGSASTVPKGAATRTATNEAGNEVLNKIKGLNKDGSRITSSKPVGPSTPTGQRSGKQVATPMTVGAGDKISTSNVPQELLSKFRDFAQSERMSVEQARNNKVKQDKHDKLLELRKFANNFKLETPVPTDLIGILAKDPSKQQEIRKKSAAAAKKTDTKTDETPSKDSSSAVTPKAPAPVPAETKAATPAKPVDTQQSSTFNRQNHRGPYPYNAGNNNNTNANGSTGGNPAPGPPRHNGQPGPTVRASLPAHPKGNKMGPPSGPATFVPGAQAAGSFNNEARRSQPPAPTGSKMNAGASVFRPNAPAFNPGGFTKAAAPATPAVPAAAATPNVPAVPAVNVGVRAPANAVEAGVPAVQGGSVASLVRRKSSRVDPNKHNIFKYIKTVPVKSTSLAGNNGGIVPAYSTEVVWRVPVEPEKEIPTMKLKLEGRMASMPFLRPGVSTPVQPSMMPQGHMGPGGHMHLPPVPPNMGPRHSPHMPAMQMQPHPGMPGHMYDERMMHQSQQAFASPRMGQMQPYMNSPAQMPAMPFNGPPNGQFRGYPHGGQFIPQGGHMGGPMIPPMYNGPPHGGPNMYQPYMPAGGPGVNGGYASPGRPQAPMMTPQGSQQGQPGFGMSPNMGYNSPVFVPAQHGPANNRGGYGGPGMPHFGSSPQNMHQFGGGHHMNHRTNSHNSSHGHGGFKNYHNNHGNFQQGSVSSQTNSRHQTPTPPTRTENTTPNTEEAK